MTRTYRKPVPKHVRDKIVPLFDSGLLVRDIAKMLHVSQSVVSREIKANGRSARANSTQTSVTPPGDTELKHAMLQEMNRYPEVFTGTYNEEERKLKAWLQSVSELNGIEYAFVRRLYCQFKCHVTVVRVCKVIRSLGYSPNGVDDFLDAIERYLECVKET